MRLRKNYVRDFFIAAIFPVSVIYSSYDASIVKATYCGCAAAILAVSVMHLSSRDQQAKIADTQTWGKHVEYHIFTFRIFGCTVGVPVRPRRCLHLNQIIVNGRGCSLSLGHSLLRVWLLTKCTLWTGWGNCGQQCCDPGAIQKEIKRVAPHPFPTHLPTLGGVCPSPENSSLSLNTEALREQVSTDGAFQYQYKLSSV